MQLQEEATRKLHKGRKSAIKSKTAGVEATKSDTIRVEHLNYKVSRRQTVTE